jgi:hypothetical protein
MKEHVGWSRTEGAPQALGRLPFKGMRDQDIKSEERLKSATDGCIGTKRADSRRV